jgi:hypothetical protein
MMHEICKVNVGSPKEFVNYKKDAYSHTKRKMLPDSQYPDLYASYTFEQNFVNTVMLLIILHNAS